MVLKVISLFAAGSSIVLWIAWGVVETPSPRQIIAAVILAIISAVSLYVSYRHYQRRGYDL